LGVQPKISRVTKNGTELERHLSRHGRPLVDNAIDHLNVAADMLSQSALREAHGL